MRCDYCDWRNSWDCEDYKVANEYMCDNFKLDFSVLSENQKEIIQRYFMLIDRGVDEWQS